MRTHITIHGVERMSASAHSRNGIYWLDIKTCDAESAPEAKFTIFFDRHQDAIAYASAINAALKETEQVEANCLCPDFVLRGQTYEIWTDSMHPSNRRLVDPRKNDVVDAFTPPLTNDELLGIYDYGKGW